MEHTLNKVVFLDRDGTLNEEVNYLHKTGGMKLLPGVPQALKKLKDADYIKKCAIAANREQACLKWQRKTFRWTRLLPI